MPFAYTHMTLDRCSNERKNKAWLKNEFHKETTQFCLINDGACFFKLEQISPRYLTKQQLQPLQLEQCIFLGKTEEKAIFAVDQQKLRFSCQESLSTLGQWQSLRENTAVLSAIDASILALAKGLVHWHKSHQFCGLCGNQNRSVEAGHARRCNECRNMTFPRTDPAVIMLVEKMGKDGIPRCLLGRQASWPEGVYSTLAGFVDPGETLESAVLREVQEESAVIAENPQYIASQPWPFPASLMLGFIAQATSDKIETKQDSLEQAQWFSREQIANFAGNQSVIKSAKQETTNANVSSDTINNTKAPYKMSSKDSISSFLITAWFNKQIGQY